MVKTPVKKKSQVNEQVKLFKQKTELRYNEARNTFDAQDVNTQEVILRIQGILCAGRAVDDYARMNALYMAVEILKDLASMDVRVASFKFSDTYCAECGAKLSKKKAHRA